MSVDRWNETQDAVKELVTLRNELVHHFLDHFDLWSEEGCVQAQQHLTDAYGRIDGHLNQLAAWAKDMERARQYAASVDASEAFGELMDSLFAQFDEVDWTQAGIVKDWKEAFDRLAVEGWAPLRGTVAR
ncbi:hypothetical protein AACH10_20850 [Ideonella sp. DXS22W]|uniref:Uncharacterized protein n=1 Tax=Pseudaquabacterium inlustre TaxID=2984192 RepID=A0ABU9CQ89_9BURK